MNEVTAAELVKLQAKQMWERELQSAVNEMLTANGWRWTHFRTARLPKGDYATALDGDKGFPDVVAVRGNRLLFAELKQQRGKAGPGQTEWAFALAAVGGDGDTGPEVHLWRPSDLLDGTIARILA